MNSSMDDWKEIGALRAKVAQLEESLAKYQACRVHDVDEKNWLRDRVNALEAALKRIANRYDGLGDGLDIAKEMRDWALTALGSTPETEGK